MGFFDDLEELFDDAGDITVEIVTNKKDLDKRISELEADGYTLTEEAKKTVEKASVNEEPDIDEELEYYRKEAKKQYNEFVKEYGLEKTKKITDLSLHCAMIHSLLTKNVPLDQSIVDEYNSLCREVYPDRCDDFVLQLTYMMVRHAAEKGLKDLE